MVTVVKISGIRRAAGSNPGSVSWRRGVWRLTPAARTCAMVFVVASSWHVQVASLQFCKSAKNKKELCGAKLNCIKQTYGIVYVTIFVKPSASNNILFPSLFNNWQACLVYSIRLKRKMKQIDLRLLLLLLLRPKLCTHENYVVHPKMIFLCSQEENISFRNLRSSVKNTSSAWDRCFLVFACPSA